MVSVDTPLVEVTETDTLRTVELARPDKLNALTPELVAGLAEAFAAFRDDPGPVRSGGCPGRATCAGLDTDIAEGDYKGDHPEMHENMEQLYRDIESCPAPVAMADVAGARGAVRHRLHADRRPPAGPRGPSRGDGTAVDRRGHRPGTSEGSGSRYGRGP